MQLINTTTEKAYQIHYRCVLICFLCLFAEVAKSTY